MTFQSNDDIQKIIYAGRLRFIIEFFYLKDNGQTKLFRAEPYEIVQRGKKKTFLLYTYDLKEKQIKSFKLFGIRQVKIINETFKLRYPFRQGYLDP